MAFQDLPTDFDPSMLAAALSSVGLHGDMMQQINQNPDALKAVLAQLSGSSDAGALIDSQESRLELDGHVEEVKAVKAMYEREKSLPPGPAPPISRSEIIDSFVSQRLSNSRFFASKGSAVRKTYIGVSQEHSRRPLKDLRPGA